MPRQLPKPLADEQMVLNLIDKTRESSTLGDLVSYGAGDIEIAPEELRALLRKRGIEDWAPVDIREKTAMRKALTLMRPKLESAQTKVIVRRVMEDEDELIYAIVGEELDYVNVDLDYSTLNQVVFHKKNGTISFTKKKVEEIERLYRYLCSVYTQREVSMMTKNILEGYGGTTLKSTGGMWYMPATVKHVTDALRDLFNEDLNGKFGKAWFRPLGIINDEDSRKTLGDALYAELLEELQDAESRLNDVLKQDEPGSRSVAGAVNRFKTAKGRAEMYASLLEMNIKEIEDRVSVAEERATAALLDKQRTKVGDDLEEDDDEIAA